MESPQQKNKSRLSESTSLHYLLHSGKNSKPLYYLRAVSRDVLPDCFFRSRLKYELSCGHRLYDEEYVDDRVNYYCQLQGPAEIGEDAPRLGDLHKKGHNSTYYYDSREIIAWFPHELKWRYLFGDIREIPPLPTIVKSRNLQPDNANAVLLKLDKCRHFVYLRDKIPFSEKLDMAIFRGQVGTRENRIQFVQQFEKHPRIDAANTLAKGGLFADNPDGNRVVPRLSLYDHLKYKYIMSLEGNDVASNLKWIMSSNSLAVTPRLTCETWFMEGRLKGDVHFVEIQPDYSDLIEKMDYYTAHPAAAERIIHNANAYVEQFRDERRERYIALRVMQRYLDLCNP